jgi:hypothetical protein
MLARTVRKKSGNCFNWNTFFYSYDIELAYAKSLRKNSEAFQKLAGRAKG